MELFLQILSVLGLVILGFLIAEFQNAFLGKQEKGGIIYFSFIGVTFTQKDLQRLILAVLIAIGIMFLLPFLIQLTGFNISGHIVYIITGYSPSIVMFYIQKKIKEKSGIKEESGIIISSVDGHPDPDKEEK